MFKRLQLGLSFLSDFAEEEAEAPLASPLVAPLKVGLFAKCIVLYHRKWHVYTISWTMEKWFSATATIPCQLL